MSERAPHAHDHDHGDLNLIDQAEEQLPPDPAPEATEEADLTVHRVVEDTSGEGEVELEVDADPAEEDDGGSG